MLDKLVDLIWSSIRLFQFFVVVEDYKAGVILRFGRFHRLAKPGFTWMIPFMVEEALLANVVMETMNVGPQSLTTKDGIAIVVASVVTFEIDDARTFLLTCEGGNQVIEDATYGTVAKFMMSKTWGELAAMEDIGNELSKRVRSRAKKFGVSISSVELSDLVRARSFRLMQPMTNNSFVLEKI